MKIANDILINEAVAATTTLEALNVEFVLFYSLQVISSDEVDTGDYDVQLQISNDNVNWVDSGSAVNVTAATSFFIEKSDVSYKYARLKLTKTSGGFTFKVIYNSKGY